MATQQAANEKAVFLGLTNRERETFLGNYVGTWANGDTMEFTLPDYKAGPGGVQSYRCWTETGDPGAKAKTYRTNAHVPLTSFNEATGVVTLTNSSGGGIANPFFSFEYVPNV